MRFFSVDATIAVHVDVIVNVVGFFPRSFSARYQAAHGLGRQLSVLLREFDSDRFAVHNGQLVTQLVSDVALVANLLHGVDKG